MDLHVFYGQNEVVGELIRAGKIDEEYTYPFVDTEEEVFEWWLVSPYLARELKEQGEVVIDALGCHWWGRTTSGQAVYMDGVIQKIAGEKNLACISTWQKCKLQRSGALQFREDFATSDFCFYVGVRSRIRYNE